MSHVPMMLRPIKPEDLVFPHEMNTNRDLLAFANLMIRPPPSKPVEVFMICDIVQCLITLFVCANVMVKKGRMRDFRIITLRKSPYGTFIVPNAIWILLTGMVLYLVEWTVFCTWIVFVQKTNRPLAEWLWYIPFPWLCLTYSAWAAGYGFVLTCSPQSPISNLLGRRKQEFCGSSLSWYHLPIPHSAWLMNTFFISVTVAMFGYNIVVTAFAGKQLASTHERPRDIMALLFGQPFTHSEAWLNDVPTQEMMDLVKVSWAAMMNVFRICCVALASYLVLATMAIVVAVLYSVPNQLFLMDHLCRIFPDAPAEQGMRKRSASENIKMLWKIGLPRNLKGPSYSAFKKTWMVTMIGHSQSILLLAAVLAFVVPSWYLFFVPWTNAYEGRSSDHQIMFIVAYTITAAFLTAGWVTGLSATLTYDEIFKAIAGLGNGHITDPLSSASQESSMPRHSRSFLGKFPGAKQILPPPSLTRSKSLQSPKSSQSPGLLRPMPSFTPSADSHITEKDDIPLDDYQYPSPVNNGNKLTIVTETTITVHHDDLEANMSGPESVPTYPNPCNAGNSPTQATPPYSFLSRKANRSSK
ncbi:related to membrane protein Dik6 [Ustilago sp. UG-2017b]|nr:related to membrane protein Dik6 [Ustilago sp. UG-2017b]